MKRILIIDHFSQTPDEPGNNRFIYLAEMLCASGYEVEVITTTFAHKTKKQRVVKDGLFDNLPYKYVMLPEPGYPKNVCLSRFYSHYVFGKNLAKYLDTIQKPDLILSAVPSLDVGKAAGNYCRKHQIPFIVDIQDVWPEAFKLVLKVPVVSDILFSPMTMTANRFYSQADKIVAVSETYKARGLKSNHKDKTGLCVYLGTDLSDFDKNSSLIEVDKPEDQLWITYVGTLGHSYNIEIVLDALNQISEQAAKNVVFNVFGDGPYFERFKEYAQKCKVTVHFFGRVDYPKMTAYLRHSDIAVNPIVKGAAQSIINKHADYAAAGLAVVNTQECPEYRNLLTEYDCGINCEVESVSQVADALERLIKDKDLREKMGRNSRRMAEERFDRKNTYKQIVAEIEELTAKA